MIKALKIGIVGSKTYENKIRIKEFVYNLKSQVQTDPIIVGLGEKYGADKYVKKYALEFGYTYVEHNLPHTVKNLYSAMPDSFYDKPYAPKNVFLRDKIFLSSIDMCVVFDDKTSIDKKCLNLIKEISKTKKKIVVIQ